MGLPLALASPVNVVRIRARWLAALPAVLLWACGGGSSGSGNSPGGTSTVPPPDPPPTVATSLTISPASAQLEALGETVQFTAEVRDQDGNAMTDVPIDWSSDAPGVATVNAMGLVTAIGNGTATIAVGTGTLSASATVTVEPAPDVVSPDSSGDREALVAFYESTGGQGWVESAHWLSDRPLDEWYGVQTDDDGRVIVLALRNNGLEGMIPPEIGQLTALEDLDLDSNGFLSGAIPPELGDLTNLTRLILSFCGLTGSIPPQLGKLGRLQTLWLAENRLSGPIPPELGALTNLYWMILYSNSLSGPIPREFGNLASLRTLRLNDNRFSGPIPSELGSLRQLTDLNLSGNALTGPIPVEGRRAAAPSQKSGRVCRSASVSQSNPIPT